MTKPIIALLYDFDKTLCTTDMEDYAFIPALGYTPAEFWHKANTFGRENRMDGLLAYMYTMIAECRAQGKDLKRDFLVACGRSMELFPGVREWFQRINAFGEQQGVTIEHYVLSSGLKEIIEGSGIAHEFKHVGTVASAAGNEEVVLVANRFPVSTEPSFHRIVFQGLVERRAKRCSFFRRNGTVVLQRFDAPADVVRIVRLLE